MCYKKYACHQCVCTQQSVAIQNPAPMAGSSLLRMSCLGRQTPVSCLARTSIPSILAKPPPFLETYRRNFLAPYHNGRSYRQQYRGLLVQKRVYLVSPAQQRTTNNRKAGTFCCNGPPLHTTRTRSNAQRLLLLCCCAVGLRLVGSRFFKAFRVLLCSLSSTVHTTYIPHQTCPVFWPSAGVMNQRRASTSPSLHLRYHATSPPSAFPFPAWKPLVFAWRIMIGMSTRPPSRALDVSNASQYRLLRDLDACSAERARSGFRGFSGGVSCSERRQGSLRFCCCCSDQCCFQGLEGSLSCACMYDAVLCFF